jgi:hypothetical protein
MFPSAAQPTSVACPLSSRAADLPVASQGSNYTGDKSFGCPICPDFLRRVVALIHSMRLSLMKGAHVDLSSTARQDIGVKPFFGLSGLPCLPTRLSSRPDSKARAQRDLGDGRAGTGKANPAGRMELS